MPILLPERVRRKYGPPAAHTDSRIALRRGQNGPCRNELDWPRFLPETPLTYYELDKETLAAFRDYA